LRTSAEQGEAVMRQLLARATMTGNT